MAKRDKQRGRERQKRIQRQQHRPEQNAGYDEVVRGKPPLKLDITDTVSNDNPGTRTDRRFDSAARAAANDVRRRDHSAD
jgi:hypothetical protein